MIKKKVKAPKMGLDKVVYKAKSDSSKLKVSLDNTYKKAKKKK